MRATMWMRAGTPGVGRRDSRLLLAADAVFLTAMWVPAAYGAWQIMEMGRMQGACMWGLVVSVPLLAAVPVWIHARLWPCVMGLAGDAARREALVLAGLADPGQLWRAVRPAVARAVAIPASAFTLLLVALLLSPPVRRRGFEPELARILLLGVATAVSITTVALAGVADVLARLCRCPRVKPALVASSVWVLGTVLAPGLMTWVFVWVSLPWWVHELYHAWQVLAPLAFLGLAGFLLSNRWHAAVRAYGTGAERV